MRMSKKRWSFVALPLAIVLALLYILGLMRISCNKEHLRPVISTKPASSLEDMSVVYEYNFSSAYLLDKLKFEGSVFDHNGKKNLYWNTCFVWKGSLYLVYNYGGTKHHPAAKHVGIAKWNDTKGEFDILREPIISTVTETWYSNWIEAHSVLVTPDKVLLYCCGQTQGGHRHGDTLRIGVFESKDLLNWREYPGNPIIDAPNADPVICKCGKGYRLYVVNYSTTNQTTDVWLGQDEYIFTKEKDTVIPLGAGGMWNEEMCIIEVILANPQGYETLVQGRDANGFIREGVFYSDDGLNFYGNPKNPLYEPPEKIRGHGDIAFYGNALWFLITCDEKRHPKSYYQVYLYKADLPPIIQPRN
jgi:hypothetical protein